MLPDFGWSELLVIAIVLIVVVGPKDLPKMLRTFGKATSSMRRMAGDFRKQFDEALKEAELDDVRSLARDMKGLDPRNEIKSALNPLGKVGEDLNEDLKRATRDLDKSDKPTSAADRSLANSGDKMRAAQKKPEKPTMSEQAGKPVERPASRAGGRKASGSRARTPAKSAKEKVGSLAPAKGNGAAKPATTKATSVRSSMKPATGTGSSPKSKTAAKATGSARGAARPKGADTGEKT
ncbi:Sec-independent protein translocase protein TatB [Oricola cellulosilytica]|uniref:Sec-independent protein translocase protein TatB n=1 Tax=Oricola cellulosilytica TaxID=1429082 RepID=A0A4R0P6M4_9HYPH|nr:Sec-independent protein translocase protein TatB [Oricola cellulosilytica]TCD12349.1 twin-arginine translocase subunit TatB [Oricola cellulosilytica]